MKTYHPKSWSQSARAMCENQICMIELGYQTIEGAIKSFSKSYRHPLIRHRTAKRLGRMVREGKVFENNELYQARFKSRKEVSE